MCAELHVQRSESAESQYVCSQCMRTQRVCVYKGEIQHRERTVKLGGKFRGNQIDSSCRQCQDC